MSYVNIYDVLADVNTSARYLAEHDDVGALQVLARIADRLVLGRKQYGALDPIADRRVWRDETRAELLDALVYLEADEMRDEACAPSPVPSWSGEPGPV